MKIINPSLQILTSLNGKKILKHIESCARTCYQSYNKESENSAENMIYMLIKSGHESVLEHFSITVKAKIDVGVYKDITRHRAGTAFSIESTRFCNYSKGKFGNELTFIKPCNIKSSDLLHLWETAMMQAEQIYMEMSKLGAKPDQLRMILPHSTAAEMTMTANLRAWRHILRTRCDRAAHPSVRQIMLKILEEFHKNIPVVFNDLYQMFIGDISRNQGSVDYRLNDKSIILE